jgi:hypothetical protein
MSKHVVTLDLFPNLVGENKQTAIKIQKATEVTETILKELSSDSVNSIGVITQMLAQKKAYDFLVNNDFEVHDLEGNEKNKLLIAIMRELPKLSTAIVFQEKWLNELREKQSQALDEVAKTKGLSDDTVEAIKRKVLGIGIERNE